MVKMVTFMLCILYHKESQRTGGNNHTKPCVKTEWGWGESDDDLYCSDRANKWLFLSSSNRPLSKALTLATFLHGRERRKGTIAK